MKFVKKTEDKDEMTFELQGEDHTFSGILVSQLLENKDVEIAQYNIPHPQVGEPEFYLKVKKGKPKDVLKKAVKEPEKEISGLL